MIKTLMNHLTYDMALVVKNRIEDECAETSKELAKFDECRGANGLLPDDVKSSEDFKLVKSKFDDRFETSRKFNQAFFKKFKTEHNKRRKELALKNSG